MMCWQQSHRYTTMETCIVRLVLLWTSLFVIMVDMGVDTLLLVPSQAIRSSSNNNKGRIRKKKQRRDHLQDSVLLIPSQVIVANMISIQDENVSETRVISKQKRNTKKKKASPQRTKQHSVQNPTSGNLPDIFWGSIPMDHLRQHPKYRPLPKALQNIQQLEDVRFFRQDSWQWDALHLGRTTTSQAAAALGFLEDHAADVLGIPRSWRSGGAGAFARLRKPALRTLEDMKRVLLVDAEIDLKESDHSSPPVWIPYNDKNKTFAAAYQPENANITISTKERIHFARTLSQNEQHTKSIRMMWGNVQEATSILTALNHFSSTDPHFTVEEVGMCGAGLEVNTSLISSSLLIGASPDGILRHSDGKVEVLEVKNHCPFYTNKVPGKNKGGKVKRFFLASQPIDGGVFPHYVPQLQMEMFCVGPECRSAVMVRQTATNGALILRMHRDDEWIEEMLYWLHRFHTDFVDQNRPPPRNFFWNASKAEDSSRYRRFVNCTNQIRLTKVEIVCQIDNALIQRSDESSPLFLDQ